MVALVVPQKFLCKYPRHPVVICWALVVLAMFWGLQIPNLRMQLRHCTKPVFSQRLQQRSHSSRLVALGHGRRQRGRSHLSDPGFIHWGRCWIAHFENHENGYYISISLVPQSPPVFLWMEMVIETTISYVKIGNHPIETTIYKWLFGVPEGYLFSSQFLSHHVTVTVFCGMGPAGTGAAAGHRAPRSGWRTGSSGVGPA